MPAPKFDFDLVVQRLLNEAYGLLAALPLFALALLAVWVCWLLGRWLSRRALLDRVARRNPFMRDLTHTTGRWLVTSLGVLVALEILDAKSSTATRGRGLDDLAGDHPDDPRRQIYRLQLTDTPGSFGAAWIARVAALLTLTSHRSVPQFVVRTATTVASP